MDSADPSDVPPPFRSWLLRWRERVRADAAQTRRGSAWLLRGLGLVFAISFASLLVQVRGLIGAQGIAPAATFLTAVRQYLGGADWLRVPTVFWLGSSDAALITACWLGIVCGALLIAGVLPRWMLLACWALSLSFQTVGDVFFNFQWDVLLLESAVCALFLAPRGLRLRPDDPPRPWGVWLTRLLLFKLMLQSGLVKLASGDPTWRDLTAMAYHHWTQPLPSVLGDRAFFLPLWFHKIETVVTFVFELVLPFFIFGPRLMRQFALAAFVVLQISIALSGSYGFFNLLTCVLCLTLLDDEWAQAIVRRPLPPPRADASPMLLRRLRAVAAVIVVLLSLTVSLQRFGAESILPRVLPALAEAVAPFRSFNAYGLFAVMTTQRHEIEVEGSDDGHSWRRYRFRDKPDDPRRAPQFVAPHMPRLDWQMWFAALGSCGQNPWFLQFQQRLLEGSAPVLSLLRENPFPQHPPKYVRSVVEDAHFAPLGSPAWWVMTPLGPYCPPLMLDGRGQLAAAPLPPSP